MSAAPAVRPPSVHRPDSAPSLPARRRAGWRQRLIEAEAGWRLGFRADSTLHAHLFIASAVLITGVVLGLSLGEWLLLLAVFAATVAAELFNLALHALANEGPAPATASARRAARLSMAATLTAVGGAACVTAGVLFHRLWQVWS